MKKTTKKIVSMCLTVVMLLSLCCVTAFAANDNGAITVANAVEGQTYSIYKLFDLESYDASTNAYSYKITEDWRGFFTGSGAGASYVSVDAQGYVTASQGFDSTTAEALAKLALQYAKDHSVPTAAAPQTKSDSSTTISFTNLPLGYYLIDSSLGTLCALTTTNPTQEVNDKNGTPTIEKKVQRNPGENWGKWNDATIGDTIKYETTVVGHAGAQNYIVHDKMEPSLTMNYDSIVIKVRNQVLDGSNYDVVHENLDDGCTFEIRFTQAFCDTIVNNERIVITYSATLNDLAEICSDSNDNDVRLQYGENNFTTWDKVKTYSYKVQIVKTTNDAAGKKVLTGAEFKLYYASNDVEIPVYEVSSGVYRPVTNAQTQTAVNIEAGTPIIEGLDAGVYYLTEEVAPEGYNKLAGKSQFEVGDASTEGGAVEPQAAANLIAVLAENDTVWTSGGVRVINQTGSVMPETGATGTMIFIAIGAVLALGGYIFLVSKKRLDAEMNG